LEKNEKALQLIEKALAEEPNNPVYIDTKCFILYNMEDYDEALKLINKTIGMDSSDAEYWYHKGIIQISREKYKDSLRCLNESIKFDPNRVEVLNAKAKALSKLNKPNEAVTALKKAIVIEPNYAEAHENLSKAFRAQGKGYQNFWEFWSTSNSRKFTAILLGIFAMALVVYPITYGFDVFDITKENELQPSTTVNIIPESYIAIIGIIIFIIMSPMIRKAKFGPVEFELGETMAPISSTMPSIIIPLGRAS